jgi:outer membrane protein insertion porin family
VEEFNQDFGTKSYGASLGFARQWSRHINTSLSFRFEQREQFLRESDSSTAPAADSEEFDSRSILVATPFISYTTRDSFIRPTKGIFTSFSFDVSKGMRNSLDDFIKYRYDLRYYTTPLKRITFAFLGRAGYISSYGSGGQIPQDQLFFLGGTSTVRGYDENLLRYDADGTPVGGLSALLGSIEARIDLGYNFELTTFYDTGSVADAPDDTGSSTFRSSTGLGLRYITPIGPIGILYGHKLDRREGESAGRFHFSIGYTF